MENQEKIPAFTHANFKKVDEKSNYKHFLEITEAVYEIPQFNSNKTLTIKREYLNAKQAVGILLVDLKQQQIVLIEQFRIGATNDEHSPWLLEIVAGMNDKAESNTKLAEREVREEAGCEFNRLIPICEYWVSPSISDEYVNLYCGLIESPKAGIFGCKDENENIKTHVISFEEAFKWLKNGKIKNSMALIAIQWLQINIDDLTETNVDNYY